MDRQIAQEVRSTWSALTQHGVIVIVVLSLVVNVVQDQRLRALSLPARPQTARDRITTIDVVDHAGVPVRVAFGADTRATILYFFSASCRWCEVNWQAVAELERAVGDRYRIVALSTSASIAPVIDRHRLTFAVYGGLPETVRRALGFGGTPHTVVVSPEGRIVQSWVGAFRGNVRRQLERHFGVRLTHEVEPTGGSARP
jgi:hypothetical protein